jgi:hypothetical protein
VTDAAHCTCGANGSRTLDLLDHVPPAVGTFDGMSDVTRMLSPVGQGDPRATEQLLPLVDDELRKLVAARLAAEKPGQTLQATALVHEAYLRLVGATVARPRPRTARLPRAVPRAARHPAPGIGHLEPPADGEWPGALVGAYRLLEQLGEGGMGLVFVAGQQHPVRRQVALKEVKPGMDTRRVLARFEAERQALARMDHPNSTKVLDAGSNDRGRPYFVMELVRGVPITDYCAEHRTPVCDRPGLYVSVCRAVRHAHQKGVIHRDLKPSNVLVESHDGRPVPKVIDFGIAKAIEDRLTEKTTDTGFARLVGTPCT